MARGISSQKVNLVNPATSFVIDQRGRRTTGIYVPTLPTPTTVTLKGATLPDGSDAAPFLDSSGASTAFQIASGSGNGWIDGDIVARLYAAPFLVVQLGAAQTGTISFQVAQGN